MFQTIAILTLIGVILVFVELFVPGMIAGICGGIALIAAIILAYVHYGVDRGNMMLAAVLLGAVVLFIWWMRAFPESRIGRRWTLQTEVPPDPRDSKFGDLDQRNGKALTALRPAGTALIEGRRVDVVAESDLIEAGAPVRVVRVEGAKVVVRRA